MGRLRGDSALAGRGLPRKGGRGPSSRGRAFVRLRACHRDLRRRQSDDGEAEIRSISLLIAGESKGEPRRILDERPLGRATSRIPSGLSSGARRAGWNRGEVPGGDAMATDVLWVGENEERDFLEDLRGFTQSSNEWQMSLDLSNDDADRAIRLLEGRYQLLDAPEGQGSPHRRGNANGTTSGRHTSTVPQRHPSSFRGSPGGTSPSQDLACEPPGGHSRSRCPRSPFACPSARIRHPAPRP